jgi:hypothetical protein
MAVHLPQAVAAYFAGSNTHSPDALAAAFARDGVVRDESQTHVGRQAIAAWAKASNAKYGMQTTPLSATQNGNDVAVTASVAGTFPGSPITLTFRFGLAADGIRSLDIGG